MPRPATLELRESWRAVSALALLAPACAVQAGEWRATPRVAVEQIYSNNILLDPDETRRHDWVTDVSSGVDISGTGARFNTNIFFNVQGLYYARDSDDREADQENINYQLQATATAEAIEQFLFIDMDASLRQENVSNSGRTSGDNINVSNNRTDVVSFGVVPRITHRFADFGTATARLDIGRVARSSTSSLADSDVTRFDANFTSGTRFSKIPWGLTYSLSETTPDVGDETRFQRIEGNARYIFNRRYAVLGSLGYEKNEGRTDSEALNWSFGGAWTPNARTSVEAGLSSREFGTGLFLTARYRSRRITLTSRYDEDRTTTTELQRQRVVVQLVDDFGDPILDPDTGELLRIPVDTVTEVSGEIILKRFNFNIDYVGRRGSASFNVGAFDSESLTGSEDTLVLGVSASRRLTPLTELTLGGGWQETNLTDGSTTTRTNLSAAVSRSLSRTLSARLGLRYVKQEADDSADEYDEFRATASLNKTF